MVDVFPSTHASLLLRIRDRADETAWQEFVALYGPMIHAYLRRQSLQDADAADVTQDILQSVARSPIDYDVQRGQFRHWLLVVTRRALHRFRHSPRGLALGTGDTSMQMFLESHVEEQADSDRWDLDWKRALFRTAAKAIRPEFQATTWDAFWSVTILQESPQAVAAKLHITPGAVYIAKSRVLSRLRKEIDRLESL